MAGKSYSYSFRNVRVTLNSLPIEGFWEGDDAVLVEPSSDNATPLVGVDGDATVSYSTDDSVRITLKLKPSSPANKLLNTYYQRARAGDIGSGLPISVRDTGNGEGGSAAEAHIIQAPGRGFGGEATEREWVIFANAWMWNDIAYQAPGA